MNEAKRQAELEPITPKRFDLKIEGKPVKSKIIWTAEAIAREVGTSADFVRDTLYHEPDSPVRKMGGRYYSYDDELEAFFRKKHK